MFFEKSDIEDNLKCQLCHLRYDVPIMLPCGETVCKRCVQDKLGNEYETNIKFNETFVCMACYEEHDMPRHGLASNKQLSKLLAVEAKKIYLGEKIEAIENNLRELDEKRTHLFDLIANKEEMMRHHYDMLRNEVYVATQSKIDELNKICDELIGEINEREEKNLQFLKTSSEIDESTKRSNQLVKSLDEIRLKCESELIKPDVKTSDNEINEVLEQTSELISDFDFQISELKSCFFLNHKKLVLVENKEILTREHIGKLDCVFVPTSTAISIKNYKNCFKLKTYECASKRFFEFYSDYNGDIMLVYLAENKVCYDLNDNLGSNKGRVFIPLSSVTTTRFYIQEDKVFYSLFNYEENQMKISILSKDGITSNLSNTFRSKYKEFKPIAADNKNVFVLDSSTQLVDVYDYEDFTIVTDKCVRSIEYAKQMPANSLEPFDIVVINEFIYLPCKDDNLAVFDKSSGLIKQTTQIDGLCSNSRHFTSRCLVLIDESYETIRFFDLITLTLQANKRLEGFDAQNHMIAIHPETEELVYLDRQTLTYYRS